MDISIDYTKAERQAQSLEQCASDLLQQSGELSSIISTVRRSWQGETASAYIRKLEILENELRANADRCSNDAADFRARINAIRRADEEARAAMEE